jgi:hypothetical protein
MGGRKEKENGWEKISECGGGLSFQSLELMG